MEIATRRVRRWKAISTDLAEEVKFYASLPDDAEVLVPSRIVALLTGVSTKTLDKHRSQRTGIPFVRQSCNRAGYLLVDVRRWLRERRVETRDFMAEGEPEGFSK